MADRFHPGATARLEHRFTAADVAAFVGLSGDDNPIHLQAAAAQAAGFEREVVHGVLVLSLISRILGTDLPGPGTILLGQEIRYMHPVYVGDLITAHVEILTVRDDKPIIGLRTWVETDRPALDGQATVLVRPVGQAPGGSTREGAK
jgi:acyl dehydratase